jgi:hypothetical protein
VSDESIAGAAGPKRKLGLLHQPVVRCLLSHHLEVMRFRIRTACLTAGFVMVGGLSLARPAVSQDSHYWTNQYGNRARLLGGAVIGSSTDLSSVYYNPGALALVDQLEFVLAGNVVQYSRYAIESALGSGREVSSTRLAGAPSLFAGGIPFKFLGKHRLAYSFLTRQSIDARLKDRFFVDEPSEVFPDLQGGSADYFTEPKLSDYWAGLTWAIPVTENIGLGVSPYVSVRSHRMRTQVSAQLLDDQDEASILLLGQSFDYNNWRLLAKLGAAADFDPLSIGITFTTPSLHILGDGDVGIDRSFVTSTGESNLLAETRNDLPADYQTAWSVGAGVGYRLGNTRLHGATEYFGRIAPNTVLEVGSAVSTQGDTISGDFIQAADDVWNWALGVQQPVGRTVDAYLSYRTDRSSRKPDSVDNIAATTWDLQHIAGGVDFVVESSEFTVGVVYAWGSSIGEGLSGLLPEDAAISFPEELEVRFQRITLVLGFTLVFE